MLTLAAADTIQGVVDQATSATYTINVMELAGTTETYRETQGQVPTSAGVLYTMPGSTQGIVRSIQIANTSGSPLTNLKLFTKGTAAANQIVRVTIPANGALTFDGTGWKTHDATGALLTSTASGGASKNYSARVFSRLNWR